VDTPRGGSGLLVDDELARAIRCESSLAIQYHWGVSEATVWRWRQAFGVGMWEPEGSKQLHRELSEAGAQRTRGKKLSRRFVQRRTKIRNEKGYFLPNVIVRVFCRAAIRTPPFSRQGRRKTTSR
jgi:hypothetical protein